jgi:hypothetical protein
MKSNLENCEETQRAREIVSRGIESPLADNNGDPLRLGWGLPEMRSHAKDLYYETLERSETPSPYITQRTNFLGFCTHCASVNLRISWNRCSQSS